MLNPKPCTVGQKLTRNFCLTQTNTQNSPALLEETLAPLRALSSCSPCWMTFEKKPPAMSVAKMLGYPIGSRFDVFRFLGQSPPLLVHWVRFFLNGLPTCSEMLNLEHPTIKHGWLDISVEIQMIHLLNKMFLVARPDCWMVL